MENRPKPMPILGNLTIFHSIAKHWGRSTGEMLMVRKAISYAKKHAVSDEQALAVMEPKHNFDSRIYTLIGYLELMAVGVLGTDLYVIGVPFLSDLTTSKPPMR